MLSIRDFENRIDKMEIIYKEAMKNYETFFCATGLNVLNIEKTFANLRMDQVKSDIRSRIRGLFLFYVSLNEMIEETHFSNYENNFMIDIINEIYQVIEEDAEWYKEIEFPLYELGSAYRENDFDYDYKVEIVDKDEQLEFVVNMLTFYSETVVNKNKILDTNIHVHARESGGYKKVMIDYMIPGNSIYSFIRFVLESGELELRNIEFFMDEKTISESNVVEKSDVNVSNSECSDGIFGGVEGTHYQVKVEDVEILIKSHINEMKAEIEKELTYNKLENGPDFHLYLEKLFHDVSELELK
ncbi:hypothetical protein [Bacillus thuringiensis]|uniref:hypothetical protein n=1 Tax=Bacillus thuringiensis TaxID=1428 RepID=UPI0021D6722F|nr:hypothetical protein [Bacillus thuringiensis]MCU7666812.1 hypothetical protein [Bacillus thuringiensis]